MIKKTILLVLFAGLLGFNLAYAADIVSPTKDNPNVSIGANETHTNLYTAGSSVTVNGNTIGDLVAAGGTITVNGNVNQEALIAGGTLNLNGSIGSHARIAGGNISINGPIGGDLVVAGGNVSVSGKSSVAGDLLAATGNLTVDVPVAGGARIVGGNITINGRIAGNVYVQAQRLVFGPQADVTGQIIYKGTQQAVVQPGAKVGNIQFTQLQPREGRRHVAGLITAAFFINLLAWMLTAFVLAWIFRGFPMRAAEETFRKPWVNLGIGILALIVVPIVAVLLLLIFIGYYLAILLFLAYALTLALAGVLSAVSLGYLILRYLVKPTEIAYWQVIIIGVVVWSLLRFIPIVGWIILAIIFLMTFGALLRMGRYNFLPRREAK